MPSREDYSNVEVRFVLGILEVFQPSFPEFTAKSRSNAVTDFRDSYFA